MTPFNPAMHVLLTDIFGYEHERIENDFEDVGQTDSGPELAGGPAVDVYTSEEDVFVYDEYGNSHYEKRDPKQEAAQ